MIEKTGETFQPGDWDSYAAAWVRATFGVPVEVAKPTTAITSAQMEELIVHLDSYCVPF